MELEEAVHVLSLLAGRASGVTTPTRSRDAARVVLDHLSVQGEPEWTPTLDHNDTHELTISADCDGSNLRHYRRTPKRVIPAGPWVPVQAPEGEEKR